MPNGTQPRTDPALNAWGRNFALKTATAFATYGLSSAQHTEFADAETAWNTAYLAATNPATRTALTIATKNDARTLFKKQASKTVSIVRGFSGITNALLLDLQIDIRPSTNPLIPPPDMAPVVEKVSVDGNIVTFRLHSPDSPKRARPAGVNGAAIFSYVGATPPTSVNDWKFEGNTNRSQLSVVFPESVLPGAKVYLASFYYNAKSESGPLSDPLGVTIQYGGLTAAAPSLLKAA